MKKPLQKANPQSPVGMIIFISVLLLTLAACIYNFITNPAARFHLSGIFLILFAIITFGTIKQRKWVKKMLRERAGESICTFARSLPAKHHDTRIVRVVYETFSKSLEIPIRPEDTAETWELDPDDYENLVIEMAETLGKTLKNAQDNPFYDAAESVAGVINFLENQPPVSGFSR
jgi:hypothetical protein